MIKSKEELNYYLKADKVSLGVTSRKHPFITDYVWKFEILLRRTEYAKNCLEKKSPIGKLIYYVYEYRLRRYSLKLGFSIPINVFGPGLCIAHYGTIVVNPNCKIGKNCWIYPNASLGANTGGPNDVPTIGDNVYIGPGVKVFGKIHIGNNISIGANSVVTKSFDHDGITIAGVPAKVINQTNSNEKIMRARQELGGMSYE